MHLLCFTFLSTFSLLSYRVWMTLTASHRVSLLPSLLLIIQNPEIVLRRELDHIIIILKFASMTSRIQLNLHSISPHNLIPSSHYLLEVTDTTPSLI